MKPETRLQRAADACDMNRADLYQALYLVQSGHHAAAREYMSTVRKRFTQIEKHLEDPEVKTLLKG